MSDPMRPEPMSLDRRYALRLAAALSLIVLTSIAVLLPVPYVTLKPGPVFNTLGSFDDQRMFTFGKGVKTYPTDGTLDFTTVSVTRADYRMSLFEAAYAYLSPDVAVVPKSLVYPEGTTAKQSRAQSAAQLQESKDASRVAGLRAAGYDVPGVPRVVEVYRDGAARGTLETGDRIRSIDGAKVDSSQALVTAVSKIEPGDTVTLGITRDGEARTERVTTRPDPRDASVPRLGIGLTTSYTFPITIDNNVGRTVGGPSAGTMFALAIYDRLTPGALTGGLRVAGTGEISADGVVGPIGGVQQKIAGAAADDTSVFLVPAANCAEALDGDDHGLELVKITRLSDAISSLEALAKDPKAKVPTCS